MTARLAHICRHPVKSAGYEELSGVSLEAGAWMPFDRLWAVTHEASKFSGGWAQKINFLRGVTAPSLMAVKASFDETTGRVHLAHPDRPGLAIAPDDPGDAARLIDWLTPIWPEDRPRPTGLVRAADAHLTDVPDPWIAILGLSSLRALGQRLGQDLSIHRWRGNLWVEGLAPWEEFDWVGQCLRIGDATIEVRERITRCKATMANPETGRRDADTLGGLETWGHTDFGVYGQVISGGDIRVGDSVEVIR